MPVSALKDMVNIYCRFYNALLFLTECDKAGISKKWQINSCQVFCRSISWYLSRSTSTLLFPERQVPLDKHLCEQQSASPCRHLPEMRSCLDTGHHPIAHQLGSSAGDCDSDDLGSDCAQASLHLRTPAYTQRFILTKSDTKNDWPHPPHKLHQWGGEDLAHFPRHWRQHWERLTTFTTDCVDSRHWFIYTSVTTSDYILSW